MDEIERKLAERWSFSMQPKEVGYQQIKGPIILADSDHISWLNPDDRVTIPAYTALRARKGERHE